MAKKSAVNRNEMVKALAAKRAEAEFRGKVAAVDRAQAVLHATERGWL